MRIGMNNKYGDSIYLHFLVSISILKFFQLTT